MIQLTKTPGETIEYMFEGFTTYQIWLLSGDVQAHGEVRSEGVALVIAGGTPGISELSVKISGKDPEIFDRVQVTVSGE